MNDQSASTGSMIPAPPAVYSEDLPAPAPNPLLLVHRLMRGRYLYAIGLAALLAPIGAFAGYMAMPGKFVSVAQIRVPAALDPLLYPVQDLSVGAAGYERVVGNEVEEMRRPERLRQAVQLISEYVNLYNQGAAPGIPDHAPEEDRDWRINDAVSSAAQLIRIAADEATFRALEEDWDLRSGSDRERRPVTMIEAVAPARLLTPLGGTLPEREEVAAMQPGELVIDPRTARRVFPEFADVFLSPARPSRGGEQPIAWDSGPGSVERLSSMITIVPPRRSELISVTAETDDPRLATIAANAVIMTHRLTSRYVDTGRRLRSLRAREAELDVTLRVLRRDVRAIRLGYMISPNAVMPRAQTQELPYAQDPRYSDRMTVGLRANNAGSSSSVLQRIRAVPADALLSEGFAVAEAISSELRTLDTRIAELELATALSTGTDDEALERADPTLRSLREEQRTLQLRLERAQEVDYGPNHRVIRDLRSALAVATARVDERISELRLQIESVRSAGDDRSELSGESLAAQLAEASTRRDEKRRDLNIINEWIRIIPDSLLDLIELEADVSRTTRLLDEVRRAREQLEAEMVNLEQGRFQYFAAQVPQRPSSDKRLPLAAAGFMGGGGFAFALMLGIGFIDRRYRYIGDVESNHKLPPIIGVLPMLTDKASGAEETEVASLTVHHIRNTLLLDGRPSPGRGRSFTVTSSGPGDGKTSVVVALGMSFAQAGYRTLVIDADLVGRGLSSHFEVRRADGLSEALRHDPGAEIAVQPIPSATPGLSVISAGQDEDFRPEHMARERFVEVIEHFRRQFDVVLIDSGPLLGSLEAGLATRCADRILLVVSRGSEQRAVAAVVKRLRDSGLRHVSLVFNKARTEDIQQSVSYVSMRSQSIRATDSGKSTRRTGALARSLQPSASTGGEPEEAAR